MRTRRRGGLFGKYVGTFVGFAVFVLAVNGALELAFTYRETTAAVIKLESEKAEAAAARISQQIAEIERQIAWTTRASAGPEQRRADYVLLLQQVPAIDELMQIDGRGKALLRVSRFAVEATADADYARDPRFVEAIARRLWVGPVGFRNEVDPSFTIAMAHSGQQAGVTVAEIDLRFLRDLVAPFAVGEQGYAYVLDRRGRLLAASDQLRTPRGSELGGLPQVETAAAEMAERPATDRSAVAAFGRDLAGRSVLAAAMPIPRTDWLVLVEQPLAEAFKPFYVLILRIGGLILLCIAVAVLAGVLLARRMVVPIRALAAGAEEIGAGAFDHRITVKTGDEIEALAGSFNRMAEQLDRSYTSLEQTVEERTRDLARSMRALEERGRELSIANEHKSQFFANMSHELRTPLNAVLGYAELLADGLYGELPPKAVEVLERVQANGRHLLGLINDVLDLSKIEAGQLVLAHDTYAMRAVIEQVVASTESLARAKGLALTAEIADDLPLGHGDERRLTQVFLNIVGNAIKFTEQGAVVIRAGAVDGTFVVTVQDTGPGIAPEDRARVFEEFHQVDNSTTRQKGGTGLGLAIARRLVALHGGDIRLTSELGAGSIFTVVLPVHAAAPATAGSGQEADAAAHAGATP
ncbi:HAMP domain-containing protein [Rhodoplanes serenus]|uniref:histidine kinase n=1 Tax=Rhodoplanes serenus TaxID=200615 RepID=A0A9X4XQJ1_9BRAD|nr:hybrid sensor histidine kinase/response regulator [Rhodoplanes serenus]MTW16646.1 HAMP domain-containing protein [Rhodoplanes serenus]